MSFFQKLTDKDYSYDYTDQAARNLDPGNNPLSHVFTIGAHRASTAQFSIDLQRAVLKQLRLGGNRLGSPA